MKLSISLSNCTTAKGEKKWKQLKKHIVIFNYIKTLTPFCPHISPMKNASIWRVGHLHFEKSLLVFLQVSKLLLKFIDFNYAFIAYFHR